MIDNVRFSDYPTVLGRKLDKYKKPAGSLKTVSIKTSDNDWPFPDTYFKSTGCTARGFSFLFSDVSDKLKDIFCWQQIC